MDAAATESDSQVGPNENGLDEEGRPQRRNRSRRRRNRGNHPEGGSPSRDRQPAEVTVADYISRAESQSRQSLPQETLAASEPKENGSSAKKDERMVPSKRSPSNGMATPSETLVNGVS
ncbi:unnamed protein product [Oncorhynchus mykiss]|nr:unnamed protein product [Oncorhynchus mykiss]